MTSTPTSTQRRVETRRIQHVELCDIVRRFPCVLANNKVCFDVNAGKVHALLGKNGAGKSALMRQLLSIEPSNQNSP